MRSLHLHNLVVSEALAINSRCLLRVVDREKTDVGVQDPSLVRIEQDLRRLDALWLLLRPYLGKPRTAIATGRIANALDWLPSGYEAAGLIRGLLQRETEPKNRVALRNLLDEWPHDYGRSRGAQDRLEVLGSVFQADSSAWRDTFRNPSPAVSLKKSEYLRRSICRSYKKARRSLFKTAAGASKTAAGASKTAAGASKTAAGVVHWKGDRDYELSVRWVYRLYHQLELFEPQLSEGLKTRMWHLERLAKNISEQQRLHRLCCQFCQYRSRWRRKSLHRVQAVVNKRTEQLSSRAAKMGEEAFGLPVAELVAALLVDLKSLRLNPLGILAQRS